MSDVSSEARSAQRRRELLELIDEVYGPVAARPDSTCGRLLHRATVPRWQDATLESWSVAWGPLRSDGFLMQVLHPATTQQHAVIVTGDACWAQPNPEVVMAACKAGVALAWFNRTEVAADPPHAVSTTAGMAALGAWAWALHRAVDVLTSDLGFQPGAIAVTGHSRGGKAALLAGALDQRIALTAANNSGTLGAGSSSVAGEGSESVAELAQTFPHWVSAEFHQRAMEGALPTHDQHVVLAAIAPRRLLITQALGDAWANPDGTRHCIARARMVYAAMGAASALRAIWREGGHAQTQADWQAVIDAARELPAASGSVSA
jgi:hypothetical protein